MAGKGFRAGNVCDGPGCDPAASVTDLPAAARAVRKQESSRGFTLIEVLVAFAILAITLTTLFHLFSTGLGAITSAERYRMATLLARSTLDEVGTELPLVVGEQNGNIGQGFSWVARIARSATVNPIVHGEVLYVPYDVAVSVSWRGRHVVTLTSFQTAPEFMAPE